MHCAGTVQTVCCTVQTLCAVQALYRHCATLCCAVLLINNPETHCDGSCGCAVGATLYSTEHSALRCNVLYGTTQWVCIAVWCTVWCCAKTLNTQHSAVQFRIVLRGSVTCQAKPACYIFANWCKIKSLIPFCSGSDNTIYLVLH